MFGFRRLFGRNIPAYAGKPGWLGCRHAGVSEHPRVCGENYHAMEYDGGRIGTSPRMRGKRKKIQTELTLGRNIPAYAGKTALPGGRERAACGTSPRMRGKPDTPTATPISDAEHPRVCGENRGTATVRRS